MKLRLALIGLLALFVLLATPISQAYAFAYSSITMPASYGKDLVQNQYFQHSTGKLIYAYYDITASRLVVVEYNSAGAQLANTAINIGTGWGATQTINADAAKIKIVNVNATYVAIGVALDINDASYARGRFAVVLWHVNSYTPTVFQYSTYYHSTAQGWAATTYISPMASETYSSKIWFFFQITVNGAQAYDFECFSFDPITHAIANTEKVFTASNTADVVPAPVYSYQNIVALDQVFLVMSRLDSSVTTPIFYLMDLDTGASSLAVMATSGSSSTYTNDYHMFNLGIGQFANGSDVYLYFNLACPYNTGTAKAYYVTQTRLLFDTVYTVVTFTSQDALVYAMNPILTASNSDISWIVGYTTDREHLKVIFPETYGGVTISYYCDITITGWDNFGYSVMSGGTWTQDSLNPSGVMADIDIIAYHPTWSSQAHLNNDIAYIYYSLSPESATWDITLTWLPNDASLLKSTSYSFTLTTTLNGYAATMNVFCYVDGTNVWVHPTNIAGQYVFSRTFSTIGLKNMTFALYDFQSGYQYAETFLLTVVSTAAPTTPTPTPGSGVLVPSYTMIFTDMLPAFLVVGIPAFALASVGGMLGFVFGAIIGVGVGVSSGVIPQSVFYLMIMAVAAMLVILVRRA